MRKPSNLITRLAAAAFALSLVLASGDAAAEDAPKPESPTPSHWYGYQTMVADAVSVSLYAGGTALGEDGQLLRAAGAAGYLFAPSMVHTTHKNYGTAVGDFALRLGSPIAGAAIGAGLAFASARTASDGRREDALDIGVIAGGLAGAVAAIIIDASVFAHDDVKAAPRTRKSAAITFRPTAAPTPTGFSAGLVGTF